MELKDHRLKSVRAHVLIFGALGAMMGFIVILSWFYPGPELNANAYNVAYALLLSFIYLKHRSGVGFGIFLELLGTLIVGFVISSGAADRGETVADWVLIAFYLVLVMYKSRIFCRLRESRFYSWFP